MTISTLSRPSFLLILDDWLRQQRFVWIGSAYILLFPCSYPCSDSGFTGTTFIIDSFGSLVPKEDCQPSVVGLWTFVALNLSRIALFIRLDGVQGSDLWSCLSRLPQLDFESISKRCLKMVMALTTFLASDLKLIGSRTSGVVELPAIIPLIAVSALGLESIANSLIHPLGQSGWFFAPSFGVAGIFRFILFFQGFHNWTLNPFHMMGVAGVLGAALL
jgi:photosystem II P680 reaction center D2 protein